MVGTLLAEAAKEVGQSCYFVVESVVLIMVELAVVAIMDLIESVEGLVAVALGLQSVVAVVDFGMSVDSVDSVVGCQKTVVGDSAVKIGHL